jgi:hypothetical protein
MEILGEVTLPQVETALRDLGGEATWPEILEQLRANRNGDYSHYLNYENFDKTAFQIIQRHCDRYEKYQGQTRFEKAGKKFRLVRVDYLDVVSHASHFRAGGESEDHRRLKDYVARNPQLFGLPANAVGETEYPLPSGDSVDVLFGDQDEWVAAEVKSKISPEADIVRGIFQCIKYRAVIEAYQASVGLPQGIRSILVLEGALPDNLVSLKNMLGVKVLDHIMPRTGRQRRRLHVQRRRHS